MSEGNKPVNKFKVGGVTATVWANKIEKDGKKIETHLITVERSYQDKDEQWKSTNSMRVNDLPKVVLVCNQAYASLFEKKEE